MSNRFEVRVSALDDFTKTFRKLNEQASKAARPLTSIQRQVGALSREMHLDKVAKGMGNVSNAAVTMGRTLGLSLGPLETMLSAGAAGGIVGGLLAAGGAALGLGVRFASAGFEINRTSQRVGVSAKVLQDWRGAAELAGVNADVLTNTIDGLGTTLQDAKWARDPKALQALNHLGIGVPMKNGLVDTETALNGIALAMSRISDPHVRAVLADALHIPQDSLPLLMRGPDAIARLSAEFRRLHGEAGPQALQWANEFTDSLNRVKVSIDGAANSIGSKLLPTMVKGMDYMTSRLKQSKEHPFQAAGGEIFDFFTAGPRLVGAGARLVGAGARSRFGSTPGTTSADRTVSGQIGGPLQQGPYRSPGSGAGVDMSMSAAAQSGGLVDGRYYDPAVQAERDRVARNMVQAELANSTNMGDRAALTRELSARRAGVATNTLAPQTVKVEVAFKGAPAGTTATARTKGTNAEVPTLVYFSMPAGDMP